MYFDFTECYYQHYHVPSKLIVATLVYLFSEALNVIGLKWIVIASFCGVGLTLWKRNTIVFAY